MVSDELQILFKLNETEINIFLYFKSVQLSAYFREKIVCLFPAIFLRPGFPKYEIFYHCYLKLLLIKLKLKNSLVRKPLVFKEQHLDQRNF